MITHGDDVEIRALRTKGWSISAIARHTGLDRKTVRVYLAGEREVGVRRGSVVEPFDAVAGYVRQRLVEDLHVRATVLFCEVRALGYGASYPTFVHRVRTEACGRGVRLARRAAVARVEAETAEQSAARSAHEARTTLEGLEGAESLARGQYGTVRDELVALSPPKPESTDGFVGSTVWGRVAAGLVRVRAGAFWGVQDWGAGLVRLVARGVRLRCAGRCGRLR